MITDIGMITKYIPWIMVFILVLTTIICALGWNSSRGILDLSSATYEQVIDSLSSIVYNQLDIQQKADNQITEAILRVGTLEDQNRELELSLKEITERSRNMSSIQTGIVWKEIPFGWDCDSTVWRPYRVEPKAW